MIWWWVPWFLGALGVSATVAFIGFLLSKRKKAKDPYKRAYDQIIAYSEELSEYDRMRIDALAYVEQFYHQSK